MQYQSKKDLIRHYDDVLQRISRCEEYVLALKPLFSHENRENFVKQGFGNWDWITKTHECLIQSEKRLLELRELAVKIDSIRISQFTDEQSTSGTVSGLPASAYKSRKHCIESRSTLPSKDEC